jgi:2-polyprenyl-3-methyl-5-hydroxy-6-metoxy-1,4-benzoquinol methylase
VSTGITSSGCSPHRIKILGTFDVVVERRVLMYLQRPAAALARAAAHLRPGGLVVCQGFVLDDTPTALPLHDAVLGWMVRMLRCRSCPCGVIGPRG